MSGPNALFDSNIVIYHMAGYVNVNNYWREFSPVISFITELEVLAITGINTDQLLYTKQYLSEYSVFDYNSELKEIIVSIRSKKKLKLPDAIIAATAIYLNIPFISSDKGFNNIPGLNLILHDPASI
jgi:predicted nucleic acid-binding protein